MAFPIALFVAMAAAEAARSYQNRKSQESSEEASLEIANANNAADWQQALLDTASNESALDPFRNQLNQGNAIGRLDFMERASPQVYRPTGPYAGYGGNVTGGYTMSPEARQSAGALKTSVMSGRTAPTMVDPGNWGQSGSLDLLDILSGQASATDPYAPNPAIQQGVRGARGVNTRSAQLREAIAARRR